MTHGADFINLEQYRIILKNVYASHEDKDKQLEMLRSLRESLNISEEVHNRLEAEIKKELMKAPMAKPVENIMGDDMHLLIEEPKVAVSTKSISPSVTMPPAPKTPPPVIQPPAPTKNIRRMRFKKYLTLGKQKYRKKYYESALDYYLKAQELLPEDDEVKFLIKKVNLKIHSTKKEKNYAESSKLSKLDTTQTGSTEVSKEPSASMSSPTAKPVKEPSPVKFGIDTKAPAAIPVSDSKGPETAKPQAKKSLGMIDDDSECISCEATGKCFWCNGSGDCDRCGGSGKYGDDTCSMCNGTGKCNSCTGSGECPWCDGTGSRAARKPFFK